MHDHEGVLPSVNPAAARSLGYSVGEMIGRPLTDMPPSATRVSPTTCCGSCARTATRARSSCSPRMAASTSGSTTTCWTMTSKARIPTCWATRWMSPSASGRASCASGRSTIR
ncbi:hypothetical protein [Rhodanobacter lindaniclasticus]